MNAGGNFYVAQWNNFEDARLIAAAPALLEALGNALYGLRNVAPERLIRDDCFNWERVSGGPCPCTLCLGKRALATATA